MKFAFSTLCCTGWDFPTLASRGKQLGYDGVELAAVPSDVESVRAVFADAGLPIACLGTNLRMDAGGSSDQVRRAIEVAVRLGAPMVKVLDCPMIPGKSPAAVALKLAEWLRPLAQEAGRSKVCLVVENLLGFRTAKSMWNLLEQVDHPALGVCWNVLSATAAGESPAVSVPVLNSRIAHVRVSDAMLGGEKITPAAIGQGEVPIKLLLTRLMGIGYAGYVTACPHPSLGEPEQSLQNAIQRLRQWTQPPAPPAEKKPAAVKPAAAKVPAAV